MLATKKGFTLIEVLVVVLIIGTLSAVAVPQYRRAIERSRVGEALTMLRAISDACERYAWDKGKSDCLQSRATFPKLDVMAKGTYSTDGKQLTTKNFEYTLPRLNGDVLTAKALEGLYKNAKITFNGREFTCIPGTSGEAANACRAWAANTWNQ